MRLQRPVGFVRHCSSRNESWVVASISSASRNATAYHVGCYKWFIRLDITMMEHIHETNATIKLVWLYKGGTGRAFMLALEIAYSGTLLTCYK